MSGKWDRLEVPKRGWVCVGVEDLGAPEEVCEMCEERPIRYVHTLRHPQWPEELDCGCICAGHMTGDPDAAREREARLRLASGRRKRWLSLKWKMSRAGNPYLTTRDGFHVVAYAGRRGRWSFRVSRGEQTWPSVRWYESESAAKLAAFDAMTGLGRGAAVQGAN